MHIAGREQLRKCCHDNTALIIMIRMINLSQENRIIVVTAQAWCMLRTYVCALSVRKYYIYVCACMCKSVIMMVCV